MKQVLILGSTGSIGLSTLDVISRNTASYAVWGVTAHSNARLVMEQIQAYSPRYAVLCDSTAAKEVSDFVSSHQLNTKVLSGAENLAELAADEEVDLVMAAIVGAAGLLPTLAAVNAGKRVLLANKESLVCAGELFMQAVAQSSAVLMPVDSEHNAIFQSLPQGRADSAAVEKILLTGSGGPFRNWPTSKLANVSPDQACAHPNWSMGRKISVDSATMMNKGLEFIELCWLFGLAPKAIEIVIHPESVIHSMVHYKDGSTIAQMGNPDMRTPIAHALSWPDRINSGVSMLDFSALNLSFEKPDLVNYPCLSLALSAADEMGAAPTVLNAANEIAVQAFLDRQIAYLQIHEVVKEVLSMQCFSEPASIAEVIAIDAEARSLASGLIKQVA